MKSPVPRRNRLLLLAALALPAAACQGDGSAEASAPAPSAASAEPLDACALLTRADAEGLLGARVSEGDQTVSLADDEGASLSNCLYMTEAGASINVLVRRSSVADNPRSRDDLVAQAEGAANGDGFFGAMAGASADLYAQSEEVPGLGDLALWNAVEGWNTLSVYWDDYFSVYVTADGPDAAAARERAVEAARRVIARSRG